MACSKFDYAKYFDINKIDLVGICKIETCNVKSVKFAESSKTNLKKHIAKNQIKQICSVRWNSTLYIIESILKDTANINQGIDRMENYDYLNLSAIDIEMLSDFCDMLTLFCQCTDTLQRENKPTLHKVIPLLQMLERALNMLEFKHKALTDIKNSFLKSIEKRFTFLKYHEQELLSFVHSKTNEQCILNYWSHKSNIIGPIVRTVLSTSSTSASVERLFSHAGNLLTKKRNSLSNDVLSNILMLNLNYN